LPGFGLLFQSFLFGASENDLSLNNDLSGPALPGDENDEGGVDRVETPLPATPSLQKTCSDCKAAMGKRR
jgi:hypothetical protein